jgi:adenylate cyclase
MSAKRACESALAMQARRKALTAEWEKLGRPLIKARTGINTGNMLVGNIGSRYRFHYGAMGDPVNLASRLEGLNKIYGTQIIVSQNTAQQVAGLFRLRELDLVRVKGREQPLSIHELLGAIDVALPLEHEEMLSLYQMGLDAYRQRRFQEAASLFESCLRRRPDDGPARLMSGRCREYAVNPPPEDWAATFEDRRG